MKIEGKGGKENGKGIITALKNIVHLSSPRELIFDKTFWLVIKEKHKHPFICLQIVDLKILDSYQSLHFYLFHNFLGLN